ncbi:MAG: hypothetical protein MI724_05015, partial [Spirochaetales bacterium]|nr:hypothetical protein [Spirochaetales bacterium]
IALSKLPSGDPSSASADLKKYLGQGTAFHNSHLDREERLIIEESFRTGELKVIAATTTLAMGVNTPASDVIIVGLDHPGHPYSVAEYKNIVGRAGRLGYSDRGTSYLVAKEFRNESHYWDHYVLGKPEDLFSRFLDKDADLRSLIIRVVTIAQKKVPSGVSTEDVIRFLECSFGAFQQRRRENSYAHDHADLQKVLERFRSSSFG